jgi:hypothetical protein
MSRTWTSTTWLGTIPVHGKDWCAGGWCADRAGFKSCLDTTVSRLGSNTIAWVRDRQRQLEADLERAWHRDPVVLLQQENRPQPVNSAHSAIQLIEERFPVSRRAGHVRSCARLCVPVERRKTREHQLLSPSNSQRNATNAKTVRFGYAAATRESKCRSKYFWNQWCRRRESNPRPRDYETLALPLSYAGKMQYFMLRSLRLRVKSCAFRAAIAGAMFLESGGSARYGLAPRVESKRSPNFLSTAVLLTA